MYSLMIVDDDKPIRERLKSMIPWKKMGLTLACEAGDSDTARELFYLYRPMIIIMDINIPIINGLELAKEIAAQDSNVRFIVVTGYTDFEYVQDSVRLGAIDLLSKPVLEEDLQKSLQKAIYSFEKQREDTIALQNTKMLLEDNLPIIREKYISYLLRNKQNKESLISSEIEEKLSCLGIDIIGNFYSVALIYPEAETFKPQDADLLFFSIKNISDEIFKSFGFKLFSYYGDNNYLNYILSNDDCSDDKVEESLTEIHEKLKFYFDVTLSSGISNPVGSLNQLSDSFQEALTALLYKGDFIEESVIHFKNIQSMNTLSSMSVLDQKALINKLSNAFKANRYAVIEEGLMTFYQSLTLNSPASEQEAKNFIFEYISTIITDSFAIGIQPETIFEYSGIFANILNQDTHNLHLYASNMTKQLLGSIFQKQNDYRHHLIHMAKDFVNENLNNDKLDLEMVSSHIGFSKIYFCKLFHKEEGVSFSENLNNQRINKAKNLLTLSNLKVFEVSYKAGYSNPKYFHYIFKRLTGMTPLEFRNSQNQVS